MRLLKATIAEPENASIARQWLCKLVCTQKNYVIAATDTYATIVELLEAAFSVGCVQRLHKESQFGL
jgi:hypothetical protein